jgi:hypothetical protein
MKTFSRFSRQEILDAKYYLKEVEKKVCPSPTKREIKECAEKLRLIKKEQSI